MSEIEPCVLGAAWNGSWAFDRSKFVVCNLRCDHPLRIMSGGEWAKYNKTARMNGTPILIETVPVPEPVVGL